VEEQPGSDVEERRFSAASSLKKESGFSPLRENPEGWTKTMKTFFAAWLILLAAPAWTQDTGKKQAPKDLQTFTSPDGTFQFAYAALLIRCELQKNAAGFSWIPERNCSAYHPVCDAETGPDITPIACIAYPKNNFTDTEAFQAATFSVETVNGVTSAEKCLAGPESGLFESRDPVQIHGVSFAVFEFSEGGMNKAVAGHIYRAFHRGNCYQLGINAATATADVFDPPARELTKSDWQEINCRLEQARDSFQFLK